MKTSEYNTISAYILGCELTRQFSRSFIHLVGKRPDQHTRRSWAEILSNPVASDLQSLGSKEKTVEQSVVLSLNLCSVSLT